MKATIDLIKTSQGYSVLQNGLQVNKIMNRTSKDKSYALPKKFTQQSFTTYPYLYNETTYGQDNKKYIILPAKAQWFNLNQIHQIQKKSLPQWFKTRKVIFGAIKSDKFEKNQDLYLKYRNHIIQLGKTEYVSPTRARKGLAGDACAIMRIHNFLQNWGLINYVYPKKNLENSKVNPKKSNLLNKQRKDCIDKDRSLIDKVFDKDHLQLLKKISKKYRPLCQFCQSICGIIWYEYSQQIFLKSFIEQNNKVIIQNSDEAFIYEMQVCASCISNGNIPVIFSINNFKKKNIVDDMKYSYEEPKDRRKINQQNKMLESIEKNKFNLKKSAQFNKITEQQLFATLMFIPLVKIEKMSRIDQQPDTQQEANEDIASQKPIINHQINGIQGKTKNDQSEALLSELQNMNQQERELYQQMVEGWMRKTLVKTKKLSSWEKSVKWSSESLLNLQKNRIADSLKNA